MLPILEAVPNAVVVLLAGLMTTPYTREHVGGFAAREMHGAHVGGFACSALTEALRPVSVERT